MWSISKLTVIDGVCNNEDFGFYKLTVFYKRGMNNIFKRILKIVQNK